MDILISGAGPVGLAMHRALNRAPSATGYNIDLIDKAEAASVKGSGMVLPPNAVLEFEKLGLAEEIRAQAHQVDNIIYAKSNGKLLSSASLDVPPLNKAPTLSIARQALYEILINECADSVYWNTHIVAIENSHTKPLVTFSHGEKVEYDLVISAEGIHSTTRSLLKADHEAHALDVTTWRFLIDDQGFDSQPNYYLGGDHAFMSFPLPNDQFYCYAQISDKKKYWKDKQAKHALLEIFNDYCAPVKRAVSKVMNDAIVTGELHSVQVDKACYGRVVLAGDALHGCPPALAQGLAMGLRDANTLAGFLKKYSTDDALRSYEVVRLEEVRGIVDESNRIIRLAEKGRGVFGRLFRNAIVRKDGPANVRFWKQLLAHY